MPREKRSRLPLTQARLKELLDYDPASGIFTHLKNKGGSAKIGTIAGTRNADGYIQIGVDGNLYYAHRLAWLYMKGVWPDPEVDHQNLDKSDNSWENLRQSNRSFQSANMAVYSDNTSGVKGVSRAPRARPSRQWRARITVNGQTMNLGNFATVAEAAEAYRKAAAAHFGGHARH